MQDIYELIDETLLNLSQNRPHGDQLRFDHDNPNRDLAVDKMKKYDLVDFRITDKNKAFQSVTHITENGLEALPIGSKAWIENHEASQLKKHTVNINSNNRFGDNAVFNQAFNRDLTSPIVQTTANDIPTKKSVLERIYWIVGISTGIALAIIAYLTFKK